MPIDPESKKKIQLMLAAAIVIAGARAGYIVYSRYQDRKEAEKPKQEVALKADYYVTPRRLRPYDLKSAQDLTGQPVWVKVGYGYTYYPYDPGRRRTNFAHESGTLAPLQKLRVTGVFVDRAPQSKDVGQVMASFEFEGQPYAVQIGTKQGEDFRFYVDDMVFIQDPHELYKHWPTDVWAAIDHHEARPGMSELQTGFALGMGTTVGSGDYGSRTLHYANGGKPVTATFRGDKVVEIKTGT